MFEQYTFNMSEHFLSALINDDWSGLSDRDAGLLHAFLSDVWTDYEMYASASHWSVDDDEPFFTRCEVTGLMSMCVVAGLYVREQAA